MKPLAIILALTITAAALPVVLESGDSPVPDRAQLIKSLTDAPDADSAADALLQHYQNAGYPATSVEVEDLNGQRIVTVGVARFGKLWLSEGPPHTQKVATVHFGRLSNRFVSQPELAASLKSFHANPLHRAVPQLQPSQDGISVDALLKIEQSAPSQFSAGYLDTGARPLPRDRFWLQGESPISGIKTPSPRPDSPSPPTLRIFTLSNWEPACSNMRALSWASPSPTPVPGMSPSMPTPGRSQANGWDGRQALAIGKDAPPWALLIAAATTPSNLETPPPVDLPMSSSFPSTKPLNAPGRADSRA